MQRSPGFSVAECPIRAHFARACPELVEGVGMMPIAAPILTSPKISWHKQHRTRPFDNLRAGPCNEREDAARGIPGIPGKSPRDGIPVNHP